MKFIILNGPAGVGKSTLAEALNQAMPFSYHLRLDAIRRHIGAFKQHVPESTALAAEVGFKLADMFLSRGQSVIFDKGLREEAHLEEVIAFAKKYDAEVFEIMLWADKETVLARVKSRGIQPYMLLTPKLAEEFWHTVNELKNKRKGAFIVDTSKKTPAEVFEEVKKHISL